MTFRVFEEAFLKRFPLPHYVALPAAGVDISDHSVKWMMVAKTPRGDATVVTHGAETLPDGVVVDGVIREPDVLSERLSHLKKKHGIKYVRASLPEEKAFLFTLSVPATLSESEIRSMIEFKLEEHVPISSEEAVFDFTPLTLSEKRESSSVSKSETEQLVAVSVFPRIDAESYAQIFLDAGLEPLSFEIEAQAIARSVVPEESAATYMVVDFGRTRSGLSVVSGNAVVFTTTIDIGGDALTESVKQMYPEADVEEIEHIKREKGCLPSDANKELCMELIAVVSSLKDEINRHLIYWQTHEKKKEQEGIKKILLCGGNSNLAGLTDYLTDGLGITVCHADVWVNTAFFKDDTLPPIDKYHSLGYAPTVGLALHA